METFSEKVTTHDWTIPTRDAYELEARSYRPASAPLDEKLPIYIHLHGGGFLFGTLSSEDAICSRIAINTGVLVVNINYRHTPEYTYPTAWNDVEDVLLWMCANSARLCGDVERLVVGGISAGACLAAALTRTLLGSGLNPSPAPKILGQVLMIPSLISSASYESQMRQMKDPSVSSYHQAANAPILNTERRKLFNDLLKVEIADPQDKRNSPGDLTTEEARKMPTTTLGIAGYDPLRDEGILYGKLLAENG
jgi:acetyl esterase/lipase